MIATEKQTALTEANNRQPLPLRWFRIPAAVSYSGISRSVIYELLTAGKIKSHRIGATRILDRESLDAYISNQPA